MEDEDRTPQDCTTAAAEKIRRVTELILDRMEQLLREEKPDTKDLKAMTGALKELSELKTCDLDPNKGKLVVRFMGSADEFSR